MRFLTDTAPPFDLTYNDVFMVPSLSDVPSRLDVDLTTPDGIGTTLPIVVANMTAVAGRRMAETVARRGGIAVLPQDIPLDVAAEVIAYVKSRHPVYETPITLGPHQTIAEALALIHKRAHGAVIVVDDGDAPLGIFTEHDAAGFDRFTQLHQVMSRRPRCASRTAPRPRTSSTGSPRPRSPPRRWSTRRAGSSASMTRKGALRATLYRPAVDADGRLMVAAAIGINGDPAAKADGAALAAGVDVLVVDTAHGHQAQDAGRRPRRPRGSTPDVPIVAGNVVTGRRRRRPGRRRRRHREGRRRSRRHVHHAHDDRRRPAAVLRRARVRRRGPPARQARVGRRRRAPPARRRPGPGRRRVERDDRLVVRRHVRERRRHPCATPTAGSTRRASAWPRTGP